MRKSVMVAGMFVAMCGSGFAQGDAPKSTPNPSCQESEQVCATLKDGRSVAVSDCEARHAGAVRVLSGDCYDAD